MPGWMKQQTADGLETDALPLDDLIGHEPGAECICGPEVHRAYHPAGAEPDRYLYVHHALDGREV